MAIVIVYPPAGTAAKPTRLTKRCMAAGTRAMNERPAGILLSVDNAGNPDDEYRIGGSTHLYDDGAAHYKWGMYFHVPPTVKRKRRFKLVVFDTATLPAQLVGQNPIPPAQIRDYLSFKGGRKGGGYGSEREGIAASGAGLIRISGVLLPSAGDPVAKELVVAYGYLPDGDRDIDCAPDVTGTILINAAAPTMIFKTESSFTDETGFWAAYFEPVPAAITATLRVVYDPSGSEEEVTGLQLT